MNPTAETISIASPFGAGSQTRGWRRWLVVGTATLTALSTALVATSASAASTPPQISVVTGHSGVNPVTAGHPKTASTAMISPSAVAYDSSNGDEAVAAISSGGTAHVYLIAGSTEANEYHIWTSGPSSAKVFGALVAGDAYVMAGNGSSGLVAFPGATTPTTGGSTSVFAATNPVAPISLAFDNAGNLVIAGSHGNTSTYSSGVQIVAKSACTSSCPYRETKLVAGGLYTAAGEGMRGLSRTQAVAFQSGVGGFGVSVDAQGNIIDGASGELVLVNEQATPVVRYGQTMPAHTANIITGTAITGSGKCGSGFKNINATGTKSPNYTFPHPYLDASGNVYLNDNSATAQFGCTWVLPAATGTLDGQSMTAGKVYSLTGAGTTTTFSNGATANTTSFPHTNAVVTDLAGNIVVGLTGTVPAVRVIAESTGTYYDQAMLKGHVYIISGGASAARTTTPGNATGFKFTGAPVPLTPPVRGLTSLINGAKGDLLLTDGTAATSGNLYLVTKVPAGPLPTVTVVAPNEGKLGGTTLVTITGSHFTTVTAVKFGTKTGKTVIRVSSNQLTVKTPSATAAGAVTVLVTAAGGTGSKATAFTYVAAPTFSSIAPAAGPTGGGTTVTITGSNFTATSKVTFGTTVAASVHFTSATTLKATTKAQGAGAVQVKVTTPGGLATKTSFTFDALPTVTTLNPATGSTGGGTTITITGTNFTATSKVTFGSTVAASVHFTNGTTLKAKPKAHANGPVQVKVTTPGGSATKTSFTFVTAPSVTTVTPAAGPTGGGTTVTITGTNFTATSKVTFGTTAAASVHFTSATTLKAVTKAEGAATVPVKVTTTGVSGSLATGFTFAALPTITSLAPTAGPIGGGTTVTITGTNFTATSKVTFGNTVAASVHFTSATTLKATTKAQGAGAVQVKVTTPGGAATKTSFTFDAAPAITSLAPAAGPTGGGTTVTITGTNFTATSKVTFGSTVAASVHFTSATTLKAVTKAEGAGAVQVKVTTPGGSGTKTSFAFDAAPTITSLAPTAGPIGGGTTVTITGTNFTATSTVTFGNTVAASVHFTSATNLKAVTKAEGAGAVQVKVTTPGGAGTKTSFTFVGVPTVTKVTVSKGPLSGGTTVTITGTNFTTVLGVQFGTKTAVTVHRVNADELTAKVPSGSVGGVTVLITTAFGAGTLPNGFTYVAAPTVTKVTASTGPATGNSTVTITGTNFTTVTLVTFGSKSATFVTRKSSTQLTVKDPAGAAGAVNVSVTAVGGTGILPSSFTYVASSPPSAMGYWEVAGDGGLFAFGTSTFHGSEGGKHLNEPIVGMAALATGTGYWEVASDGGLFAFGAAMFHGSEGGKHLNAPIVGMAATPTGNGYWEVASDGGLFAFGAALFHGSEGGKHLNESIVGMATTPTGNGYWEVASDGGLFAFGAAMFHGSEGGKHLNESIVGMAATPTGNGYWEVASDGGLFAFGAALFHGSEGGKLLNEPIVGMSAAPTGNGYWEVASDGGLFAFGTAKFAGSEGSKRLDSPIVGMVADGTS